MNSPLLFLSLLLVPTLQHAADDWRFKGGDILRGNWLFQQWCQQRGPYNAQANMPSIQGIAPQHTDNDTSSCNTNTSTDNENKNSLSQPVPKHRYWTDQYILCAWCKRLYTIRGIKTHRNSCKNKLHE